MYGTSFIFAFFKSSIFSLNSSEPPSKKISPVVSSITSSTTVDPIKESIFFDFILIFSIQLNALKISALVEKPNALNLYKHAASFSNVIVLGKGFAKTKDRFF